MIKVSQGTKTIAINGMDFLTPYDLPGLIRLGRDNDGGYVVMKQDVITADALISFGINNDWSFEKSFLRVNSKANAICYDYSISKKIFRRYAMIDFIRLIMCKININDFIQSFKLPFQYTKFFSGSRAVHHQKRVHNYVELSYDTTIDQIFQNLDYKNIFMKIDIEGSEYRIIDELSRFFDRINSIVMEIHDIGTFRSNFNDLIRKIQKDFAIVHIHANNDRPIMEDGLPDVLEITFTRKNLVPADSKIRKNLPLQDLDMQNTLIKQEINFEF